MLGRDYLWYLQPKVILLALLAATSHIFWVYNSKHNEDIIIVTSAKNDEKLREKNVMKNSIIHMLRA